MLLTTSHTLAENDDVANSNHSFFLFLSLSSQTRPQAKKSRTTLNEMNWDGKFMAMMN